MPVLLTIIGLGFAEGEEEEGFLSPEKADAIAQDLKRAEHQIVETHIVNTAPPFHMTCPDTWAQLEVDNNHSPSLLAIAYGPEMTLTWGHDAAARLRAIDYLTTHPIMLDRQKECCQLYGFDGSLGVDAITTNNYAPGHNWIPAWDNHGETWASAGELVCFSFVGDHSTK